MTTFSVVLSNLGRVAEADRIRARIVAKLRGSTDPWSRKQRMILHRTASAVLPPEAASSEILAAVEYFAPPNGTRIPRHAFQYIAALVNYSGVLFDLGRYSQSADAATEALELEATMRGAIRTVERYKICNNLAISALRDGRLSPGEVVAFLRAAIQHEEPTNDRVLILNNLGVAEALAGNLDESLTRLRDVYQQSLEAGADRYYTFFVGSNLAVVTHLSGNSAAGIGLWKGVREMIDGLPQYDHAMINFRHAALEAAFMNSEVKSPSDWDSYLHDQKPRFGESWNYYKYGFLLSDIVVWSES
jgi:tetratricopeptide (TPR) repeat protein